jgi:hypothetical protein
MSQFFTRERFGRPQFFAGVLLLAFLGQAAWLVDRELSASEGPDVLEQVRIEAGWHQFHGLGIAGSPYQDSRSSLPIEVAQNDDFDSQHSPLLPLLSAAPLLAAPKQLLHSESFPYWRWLARLPFLVCGGLLGASLWYVSRRICGNTGGFIALTLYCFSPSMIQAAAVWHTEPEILAAWGTFGSVFTAIAVAHTLYAQREVVLWNWRRIALLGISLAFAVGSQFSMIILGAVALAFLLYLAPVRRGAAVVIWMAGCLLALAILFATYFFHFHAFLEGMRHASFGGVSWRSFVAPLAYKETGSRILKACPALVLLVPVSIAVCCAWPHTRYFGNAAPGLTALLFIVLGLAHPDIAGSGFLLASIPFLLIFVSGILADLMETPYRLLVIACVGGLLVANIFWSVLALAHVPAG